MRRVLPLLFRTQRVGSRRLIIGALALLIGLQGIGSSVFATLGPLHSHKATATIVVLDDFRRGPSRVAASERAVERHGHAHGTASTLRHHHAVGDASVNLAPGEAVQGLDADEGGFGASLAALVALLPEAPGWLPQAPNDVLAARRAWVPQSHFPEPLQRPPRSA
jgi:hypothetical protein